MKDICNNHNTQKNILYMAHKPKKQSTGSLKGQKGESHDKGIRQEAQAKERRERPGWTPMGKNTNKNNR